MHSYKKSRLHEIILQDEKEEVDEHMDALVADKMTYPKNLKLSCFATVFESAVNSKVKEIAEQMEADVQTNYETRYCKSKRRVN